MVIAVVIALILIIRLRLSPLFGLVVGALYYGIATGVGARQTATLIAQGFGGTMTGIGLTVAFGVVIGDLVAASGGVQRIVRTVLSWFSPRRVPEALLATGLAVSIPVFFDVGFVILTPIARRLGRTIKKSLPFVLGPLVVGLGTAHMMIPPTPGPLVVADTLGVPLGTMIAMGLLVGLPSAILALILYKIIAGRPGFWAEADEEPVSEEQAQEVPEENLPSFGMSILPIAVPVVLIVLAALVPIWGASEGSLGRLLLFLGDRNIAMLLGAVAALGVASSRMDREALSKAVNTALNAAGIILVITGAGGSLGAVLGATNIGPALANPMIEYQIPAVFLAWVIAAVIKTAQGSGTVAIVTTASLMAPLVAQLGLHPVWVALAIASGGLMGCHVNDSAFWVISKVGGLSTRGGFKVYTLATALNSLTSLVVILILQTFLFR